MNNLTKYSETYNKEPIIDIYRHLSHLTLKAKSREFFLRNKREKLVNDFIYSEIITELDKTSNKLRKRLNIVFA